MSNANLLLAKNTLFPFVKFIIYEINDGKEEMNVFKTTKKMLLSEIDFSKIQVKLVENFPEDYKTNILYIKKGGRTCWIWEDKQ